jgi:hypothetical protein
MSEENILFVKKINNKKWLGYNIKTNIQNINMVIENQANCCERWDLKMFSLESNDYENNNFSKLINEKISSFGWINSIPKTEAEKTFEQKVLKYINKHPTTPEEKEKQEEQEEDEERGDYERKATLVIKLTDDTLYLHATCDHNGYYKHNLKISWKNYKDRQEL